MDEERKILKLFQEKSLELWNKYKSKDENQTLEDFIVGHRVSDDEKEADVAKELDDFIVTYYAKREELNNSDMEPGEWLEHEVETTVKDLYPEATEDDVAKAKEDFAKQMTKNNDVIVEALAKEMNAISDEIRNADGMESLTN